MSLSSERARETKFGKRSKKKKKKWRERKRKKNNEEPKKEPLWIYWSNEQARPILSPEFRSLSEAAWEDNTSPFSPSSFPSFFFCPLKHCFLNSSSHFFFCNSFYFPRIYLLNFFSPLLFDYIKFPGIWNSFITRIIMGNNYHINVIIRILLIIILLVIIIFN